MEVSKYKGMFLKDLSLSPLCPAAKGIVYSARPYHIVMEITKENGRRLCCFESFGVSLTNNQKEGIPCLILRFSLNCPCLLGVALYTYAG